MRPVFPRPIYFLHRVLEGGGLSSAHISPRWPWFHPLSLPSCRPALLLSHLLPLWPLLLLPLPPPAQGSSSSPRTPPAPARPPCARGGPSAPRHVCVWERAPPPSRSPRVPRSRRQVLPGTSPPATPSGFEEGPPSSQYTPGLLCGVLQCLERMGGTPTLPILDFCPWTMVSQPHMGWPPHTPTQTPCGVMEMGLALEKHPPPCGQSCSGAAGKVSGSWGGW